MDAGEFDVQATSILASAASQQACSKRCGKPDAPNFGATLALVQLGSLIAPRSFSLMHKRDDLPSLLRHTGLCLQLVAMLPHAVVD